MVVLMTRLLVIGLALWMANGEEQKKPDRTVHITAERFSFSPSRVKVRQGVEVEFVVTSEDTDHGFRIPAAGIDGVVPQQGKGELRVRFVAKEKGRYVFECSRPCGAGHNLMRGTIEVE
jgi:cytochrome c oxidase subunit 2